jgi:hypothetical protein
VSENYILKAHLIHSKLRYSANFYSAVFGGAVKLPPPELRRQIKKTQYLTLWMSLMFRNTHLTQLLATLSLSALIAIPAIAAPAPKEQSVGSWSWSAHVGNLNIDSKVAREQGIDSSAWVIGVAAERLTSDSSLGFLVGLDFIGYDDNYSFSQDTNHGNKSSDASGAMVYAEFGPKVPFGQGGNNYFLAHAGVSGIFSSERGIGYCSDCYSEDIKVKGGLYGVLGVGHSFSRFDMGLQFQQYFSGDLDNSLRLNFSTSF